MTDLPGDHMSREHKTQSISLLFTRRPSDPSPYRRAGNLETRKRGGGVEDNNVRREGWGGERALEAHAGFLALKLVQKGCSLLTVTLRIWGTQSPLTIHVSGGGVYLQFVYIYIFVYSFFVYIFTHILSLYG